VIAICVVLAIAAVAGDCLKISQLSRGALVSSEFPNSEWLHEFVQVVDSKVRVRGQHPRDHYSLPAPDVPSQVTRSRESPTETRRISSELRDHPDAIIKSAHNRCMLSGLKRDADRMVVSL
jgi:hypothetical protein